ncbi:eCIS core domain-containing protein [Lutibacter citreus]|uniref:eCIS core domain-containing protein n=1 Tax=Lutibacter citreus TaxID=2138210 RepID=UPI000DBE0460|nr:DUF4157 domain-containing protein [Lutibacter citreus]
MNTVIFQKKENRANNQAASKKNNPFFSPLVVQKKLSIGASDDAYEIEADSVADKVVNMSDAQVQAKLQTGALVQRKCSDCEKEEIQKKPIAESISPYIQKSALSSSGESTASNQISSQINSSKGSGNNMSNNTRNYMESRFGTDFSDVKIHTGSNAIQLSKELNAQAFTVGNDIYFNEGKYNPSSNSGKHLLAHELTHTLQQGGIQRKMIQKSVETNDVSCGNYDPDHPTMRVIGNLDPVGFIETANNTAISYLDNVILELEYYRNEIVNKGETPGWPTFSDCFGTSINLRFRRFNSENDSFWRGSRGATRLIHWYSEIRRILASGTMKYTCITDYAFCGTDTWAGASFGLRRIYFCLPFWNSSTLPDRALTIIHETSHTFFNTSDYNGRTMGNAHCIEQFVADINNIAISDEFESACGGKNNSCS